MQYSVIMTHQVCSTEMINKVMSNIAYDNVTNVTRYRRER